MKRSFVMILIGLLLLTGCKQSAEDSSTPSNTQPTTSGSASISTDNITATTNTSTSGTESATSSIESTTVSSANTTIATTTTITTQKTTTVKPTTAVSNELGESVLVTPKAVRYIGRYTYLDNELEYAWKFGNSGIEFTFRGTAVNIDMASTIYPQQFKVWIDGKVVKTFVLDEAETIQLADGLTNGDHQCKILKMNGPNGYVYVSKIRTSKGGTVYRSTASASRKILVIGDSITSGFGILDESDAFLAEDGTQVYQQQAADLIGNIEVQTVALSGLGIARNAGNTEPHSGGALWMFSDYDFENSSFKPDLVIIALGTNDAAATDQEFVEDATTFLKTILEKYPGTPVLWSYGLMGQSKTEAIQSVIRRVSTNLKVDNIHFLLHQGPTGNEGIGLAGHPSLATHTRVANELAAKMKEIMGW